MTGRRSNSRAHFLFQIAHSQRDHALTDGRGLHTNDDGGTTNRRAGRRTGGRAGRAFEPNRQRPRPPQAAALVRGCAANVSRKVRRYPGQVAQNAWESPWAWWKKIAKRLAAAGSGSRETKDEPDDGTACSRGQNQKGYRSAALHGSWRRSGISALSPAGLSWRVGYAGRHRRTAQLRGILARCQAKACRRWTIFRRVGAPA